MANIPVDPNLDKAQRKVSTANLANFAGVDCQLLVVKETHRPVIMDGTTAGGAFQTASLAELEAAKTELTQSINTKQPSGDYLTKSEAASTYATKSEKVQSAATADNATHATSADTATNATNATNAVKASQDASGNVITATYATKTELAGKANATHTHATSEVTGLDTALAGKANTSHTHEISNVTGLQDALNAKADTTSVAPKAHTHAISDVTNLQTTLDGKAASSHNHDSTYIKISGSRGNVGGYENLQSQSSALTVSNTTRDGCCITGAVKITVNNGSSGQTWTKTIGITNASATVTLGSSWKWVGGSAPTIAAKGVLVVHWCGTFGIANFVSPS